MSETAATATVDCSRPQQTVGTLEDEALRRKERLKALKRGELSTLDTADADSDSAAAAAAFFPKPIFRNYTPKDESLKPSVLPKPKLIEIENEIKDRLEGGKPQPLIEKEIDLATLAPQKIDWDLKRDVEKKLRILERRTQRAIVELLRNKLKQQKDGDLAELVSVGSRANEAARKEQKKLKSSSSSSQSETAAAKKPDSAAEDDNENSNSSSSSSSSSDEEIDSEQQRNDNDSDNENGDAADSEASGDVDDIKNRTAAAAASSSPPAFINDKHEISDDDDY